MRKIFPTGERTPGSEKCKISAGPQSQWVQDKAESLAHARCRTAAQTRKPPPERKRRQPGPQGGPGRPGVTPPPSREEWKNSRLKIRAIGGKSFPLFFPLSDSRHRGENATQYHETVETRGQKERKTMQENCFAQFESAQQLQKTPEVFGFRVLFVINP